MKSTKKTAAPATRFQMTDAAVIAVTVKILKKNPDLSKKNALGAFRVHNACEQNRFMRLVNKARKAA